MATISAVKGSNGLTVVSTFSGCGGSCLGFEMAGFDVRWACEFVPAARETYLLNHPGVPVDDRDIRFVRAEEILRASGLRPGELDVLEGSPPCASFSTAGKREKAWGKVKKYSDVEQRSDDLFFEFSRLLKGLQPRAFVAENVSGLVKGNAWGYFEQILRALRGCGYRVIAKVLDARWLGVPQDRKRLIFVGVRADLGLEPVHPSPLQRCYSIRDALPWIGGLRWDSGGQHGERLYDVGREAVQTIMNGRGGGSQQRFYVTEVNRSVNRPVPTGPDDVVSELAGTAIGREWSKLHPGETSDRYFNLVRPHPDKPCPTVTAVGGGRGVASVTHPSEPRKFTIFELRRLCGFPDDFQLTGSFGQQWERLGRSVPPVMMFHVARALRDEVFGQLGLVREGAREACPT